MGGTLLMRLPSVGVVVHARRLRGAQGFELAIAGPVLARLATENKEWRLTGALRKELDAKSASNVLQNDLTPDRSIPVL
jgi:hypothetical protein